MKATAEAVNGAMSKSLLGVKAGEDGVAETYKNLVYPSARLPSPT